jgi:putative ABC transport system permease protein
MTALFVDLRLAWLNLLEHRRRTLLLGAAIGAVTCLFVLLAALSQGVSRTLVDSAVTLTTGHLNVNGYFKVSQGRVVPLVTDYQKVAELVRAQVPELDYVAQRGRGAGKLVAENVSMGAGLNGVDLSVDPELRNLLTISTGNIDDLARPNALLIFEQQAKTLQVGVGDAVTIVSETARGVANTMDCQVVAIARDIGILSSWNVFMSSASLATLLQQRPDVSGVLQLHVKPAHLAELTGIAERLRRALGAAGYRVLEADPRASSDKLESIARLAWSGQKLDVSTWQDEVSSLNWSVTALNAMSSLLVGILLSITMAGTMNSLWIATRERTREIGTLRAIGMQRSGVARLFLIEAALLGFLAAAAGIALGIVIAEAINWASVRVPLSVQLFVMRDTLKLVLEPSTAVRALLLMSLTTSLAALYPALRAAQLKPVSAMAHVG